MATTNDPVTYSVPAVANILNCHQDTVYDLIQTGRLHAVRLGRKYVISDSSLRTFLAGW